MFEKRHLNERYIAQYVITHHVKVEANEHFLKQRTATTLVCWFIGEGEEGLLSSVRPS